MLLIYKTIGENWYLFKVQLCDWGLQKDSMLEKHHLSLQMHSLPLCTPVTCLRRLISIQCRNQDLLLSSFCLDFVIWSHHLKIRVCENWEVRVYNPPATTWWGCLASLLYWRPLPPLDRLLLWWWLSWGCRICYIMLPLQIFL